MARVTLDDLRKEYGSLVAVDDVSITLPDGELLVLVGPSGSGKSTALRMVAGLTEPTSGSITFDDLEVTETPPEQRDISMVFQDLALYPHMTAFENIAFPLKADGAPPQDELEAQVQRISELVDADHLLEKKVTDLSGGQRQRVALARALVQEPEVFLLDEPLSDLDELLKRKLRSEIANLQNDLDVTTIHVTHDQEEAMTIGDRIAVMREGALVQSGPAREVFEEPTNVFVATFIGSPEMNVFETRVEASDGDGTSLTDGDVTFRFTGDLAERVSRATGDEVAVGMRPQSFSWSSTAPDREGASVPVDVEVVELVGTEEVAHASTAGGEDVRGKFPTGTVEEGESGYFLMDVETVHLFDGHGLDAERIQK